MRMRLAHVLLPASLALACGLNPDGDTDSTAPSSNTVTEATFTATNSGSASNTNTESDSHTVSDSNTVPIGSASDSETNDATPTSAASNSESQSNSDSATDSATNTATDSNTDSSPSSVSDTDGDSGIMCVSPSAFEECESCLYDLCNSEYCTCQGDEKCLCAMNCFDSVTGGDGNRLDDTLALKVRDLIGGQADGELADHFNNFTDQDFDDLGNVLECLTNAPCGVPLGLDLEEMGLDPSDLDHLGDVLDVNDFKNILLDVLEVSGNALAPLLTCSELLDPDGECGTLCPIEKSLLED